MFIEKLEEWQSINHSIICYREPKIIKDVNPAIDDDDKMEVRSITVIIRKNRNNMTLKKHNNDFLLQQIT